MSEFRIKQLGATEEMNAIHLYPADHRNSQYLCLVTFAGRDGASVGLPRVHCCQFLISISVKKTFAEPINITSIALTFAVTETK